MSACYVYTITSPNGKRYVGKTLYPELRFRQHARGTHKTKGTSCVHNAIAKYGTEAMLFKIIAVLDGETEAFRVETALVKAWDTLAPNGYNLQTGGEGGFTVSEETRQRQVETWTPERRKKYSEAFSGEGNPYYGRKASEETRKKISAAHRGRVRPEEWRNNISEALKGKPKSAEHRRKMSARQKGKVPIAALAAAIIANTGRPLSETHRKAVGDAHRGEKNHMFGKKLSEEQKKLCASFTGRTHTDETKAKMALARKAYWDKKKKDTIV